MTDFNKLRENRNKSLEKLIEEQKKLERPSYDNADDRFWYPSTDKSGNGSALIRFLPEPPGEDLPYVRIFSHSFQGPTGSWYIENSLTTLGENDPVSEYNSKLWNTGLESDKDKARAQKRRLGFISNVYIIKDPANPENEGKVKLFRYGKKIFDKINDVMNPPDDDLGDAADPINPFCLWDGANFKIVITTVDKFRNYDKSSFQRPGPLLDDNTKLEEIWHSQYSLEEFIAKDKFKPYEELKSKLVRVLGLNDDTYAENSVGQTQAPAQTSTRQPASSPPWKEEETVAVDGVDQDLQALFDDLDLN